MTGERFAVPRNAEVWQVTSKTFSRQSITGTDRRGHPISPKKMSEAARLRRQVLDLLKMLPGDVLLVTYKAAEEVLQPDLPPHVQTAHFGALRGLNSYEHCETAVVMGREQPSAQAIEALTRPFCTTDPEPFIPIGEYVPQSRGRRMRNGGANVVEVQVHPDPRCQAMLEQVREAEIAQAVDRVRPVFNRRRIIVLTNIALDLTVDHALTWPALRPGKFAYAFAQHGVLPLSAGDLRRGFPSLWPSENTAKSDLSRSGLIGCNPQIIILFGVCTLLDELPHQAVYRRKGQKGKPARALVRAALSDPRAGPGKPGRRADGIPLRAPGRTHHCKSTPAGARAAAYLAASGGGDVCRGASARHAAGRRAPTRHARHGRRDEAHGPGHRTCRGRPGGRRMTSHHEPSRGRQQRKPIGAIDAGTAAGAITCSTGSPRRRSVGAGRPSARIPDER